MKDYFEVNITHDLNGQFVLEFQKDVTYIATNDHEYHLQIIYPQQSEQTEKKYPCMVYFMSTTNKREEIYHKIPRLSQFAQRGYVVVLMETPQDSCTYEMQAKLMGKAFTFLKEHGKKYSVDTDNMFIWRDGDHEEMIIDESLDLSKEEQEPINANAIVCFGGKEQMKYFEEKFDSMIPPVLMIPCDQKEYVDTGFWTEDVFDIIEDFISSYIA